MTLEQFEPHPPGMLDRTTDSWTMVLHDVAELSRLIADTDFVPKDLRGNVGKVAAVILHGRELGLPPLTALSQTAVINGRPTMSAEALRGLILQAGHELVFEEQTSSRCRVRGRRQGSDNWTTVEWTSADAERAGLARRDTYRSYPRQMLAARATAELARLIFPDVMHGMRAAEEADDYTTEGEKIETSAAPAPAPRNPVRRATKKTAEPVPDTTPAVEAPQNATQGEPDPTPPPARQRPTIKPRGHTPTPEPATTETEPTTEDNAQPFIPPGRATDGQITAIVMHLERLGVQDRGQRITTTAILVGRKIASTKDLDDDEAAKLIDRLSHLRNAEALEQAVKDQT